MSLSIKVSVQFLNNRRAIITGMHNSKGIEFLNDSELNSFEIKALDIPNKKIKRVICTLLASTTDSKNEPIIGKSEIYDSGANISFWEYQACLNSIKNLLKLKLQRRKLNAKV